jgi:DNA-binding response OmpR family regulator
MARHAERGPATILVIDDDAELLSRTYDYLTAKGHSVITTDNVFTVAALVGRQKPDIVVLDVRMPALSGAGVATTLGRFYAVPILFHSAVDEDEGRLLAAQHLGARFISKSHGLRGLNMQIEGILEEVRTQSRPH